MKNVLVMRGAVLVSGFALFGLTVAQMNPVRRDNLYNILFTQSDFSDANFSGDIDQTYNWVNAGDAFGEAFGVPTYADNVGVTATPNINVTNFSYTPGTADVSLEAGAGTSGVSDLHFEFPFAGGGIFSTGVSGGLNTLTLAVAAASGVIDGGVETLSATAPGDWTNLGVGSGESTFSFNDDPGSGWTEHTSFSGGVTTLFFENDSYRNDGTDNLNLNWALHGSRVLTPEPCTMLLAASSLALAARRSRRKQS